MNGQVGSGLVKKNKIGFFGTEPQRRRGEDLGIKKEGKEGKKGKKGRYKIVTVLSILILSGGSTQKAHAGPGGGSMAVIELGTPMTYAFNEATVSARNGMAGTAALYGSNVDGTRVKLYETTIGYTETLAVTYYGDPELVSLAFEGTDGDGARLSTSVQLRFGTEGPARIGSDIQTLAALEFPYRLQPFGSPRRTIRAADLAGEGPKQAARIAVARLFIAGRRATPLTVLTLWSLAVIVGAGLWHKVRTGRMLSSQAVLMAALAGIAGAVAVTALALGTAPAELFSVTVPASEAATSEGSSAGSGSLVRRVTEHGSYRGVSWSPEGEEIANPGTLWFIGNRSPQSAAVPVTAFNGYRRVRSKTPPLVVAGSDGTAMLAPAPFLMAWGLHE